MKAIFIIMILCLISPINKIEAQFSFSGQLIQRGEYRNGFGELIQENEDASSFISQRARIEASFSKDIFKGHISFQDVRTWGNTPQVKYTDPFLSLYEAWGEVSFSDSWSLKLGRQELNYDNFRFLGNLDWALQGRSHDFALVKFETEDTKLHFGGGYNQDGESLTGNIYRQANQYKVAQMIRFENSIEKFKYVLLFWNNGMQFIQEDTLGISDSEVRYMQTLGVPNIEYSFDNLKLSAFYYQQFGKDINNFDVSAYNLSINASYKIETSENSSLLTTIGFEYLSGSDANDFNNSINKSFNPLYGTNHRFNGFMDYFYVAGRYINNYGLRDYYLRNKYSFSDDLFISLNSHLFQSFKEITLQDASTSSDFGIELDLTLGVILSESVSIQAGYSQLFSGKALSAIQSSLNEQSTQNWAYLMIIFRPDSKNKFIGLLF